MVDMSACVRVCVRVNNFDNAIYPGGLVSVFWEGIWMVVLDGPLQLLVSLR